MIERSKFTCEFDFVLSINLIIFCISCDLHYTKELQVGDKFDKHRLIA